MDLITGNLKQIYKRYLMASFLGAILPSVYGLVDMIVVGQYHGPEGSAAMAIIAPIWNVVYSLGMLTGLGGAILFSIEKSSSSGGESKSNEYFTTGIIMTGVISLVLWMAIIFFDEQILTILGANEELMPLAKRYVIPVKFALPVFLFMQFMAAFLRNDGNPALSTKAVLVGGIFNIVGDIFFVFTLNMGIFGAGLATCIGATLTLLIMLTHFRGKQNTLKLVKTNRILAKSKKVLILGFSTCFVDMAVGILTMLFNIQIMKHMGSDELAIYGIIVNIAIFVQCCAYGVGQSAQPIFSANYSSHKPERIKEVLRYGTITTIILSLVWVFVTMAFPKAFVYAFMKPTDSVLEIAPLIIRTYCISFALLPFNIYMTYYFQSIMKPNIAFIISVARGLVISGGLILGLPVIFGANSIWIAMPITEVVVFIFIIIILYITRNKK